MKNHAFVLILRDIFFAQEFLKQKQPWGTYFFDGFLEIPRKKMEEKTFSFLTEIWNETKRSMKKFENWMFKEDEEKNKTSITHSPVFLSRIPVVPYKAMAEV